MRGRVFLVVLLLIPLSQAAVLDARYEVGADTQVTYELTQVDQPITIPLPYDVQTVALNANQTSASQILTIYQDTNLSFTTSSLTRQRGYFAADLGRINATIQTVTLTLPETARLERALTSTDPSIKPTPTNTYTDGKHLIFEYTGESLEPARAVIIDYQTNTPEPRIIFISATILILAGLLTLLFGRRTNPQEHTRNLYREEKMLVEELLQAPDNELWQKTLVKKSGMSAVKVSRKLRNLEAKGVIEKVPYGNTNKIRIKRSE